MTSFVFRAAVGVVNGVACAVNHLLEVMYPPRYDTAHIWDELAAPADPHPAGVADPAAETVPPDLSAAGSPLTWSGWAEPAILEVLAEHTPWVDRNDPSRKVHCDELDDSLGPVFPHWDDWREHIAPIIADRIGCDPNRAVLALTSLQKQ